MYESYFGLRERPFDVTSDRRFLLLTAKHQEALAHLEYGVTAGSGITLLVGEPGTGKTTLLRRILASRERLALGYVVLQTNPTLTRAEFFDFLADAFELTPAAGRSKTRFLRELQSKLVRDRSAGMSAVLMIDEAQVLPDELLEEVSLLSNLESETEKLLRVVLASHRSLGERLNYPRFRQLKQRIGLRCLLPPLDLHETASYIAYRLCVAGGSPGRVFTRDAVVAIYEQSRGVPRTINVICENALLTAYGADQSPVDDEIILEVCGDFDLATQAETTPEARPRPVVPNPTPGRSERIRPRLPRRADARDARALTSDAGRTTRTGMARR